MRIKRVFNNNTILAYKDSSEVVIFGKGIGFGKKHGDEVDNKKIEKVFVTNENHLSSFKTLFEEVSTEYADFEYFARMSPVRNKVPYHPSSVSIPPFRGWNPLCL